MEKAFTVVEIMIVVMIVALLAAIAIPSCLKAKKESEAKRAKEQYNALVAYDVGPKEMPLIQIESKIKIVAMGSCPAFTVYKVIDVSETFSKNFYVVVGSNQIQKISLEKE